MRLIIRSLLYLAAFLVPILLSGAVGLITSVSTSIPRPADAAAHAATVVPPPAPSYEATKPTVAVVLGELEHEITDTIGPYAMFAETGLYNVYMVAQTRKPRAMAPRTGYTLTGAVDLIPHFTFGELDALLGRSPDIVVVPQMNGVDAPGHCPHTTGWHIYGVRPRPTEHPQETRRSLGAVAVAANHQRGGDSDTSAARYPAGR
jgi:AraC family transcriptional regulator, transcriptional activator FtrA